MEGKAGNDHIESSIFKWHVFYDTDFEVHIGKSFFLGCLFSHIQHGFRSVKAGNMGSKGGYGAAVGAGATGSIQNILIPFEMEGSDCMGQIVFFGKTHGPGFEVLRLESEGFSDFI